MKRRGKESDDESSDDESSEGGADGGERETRVRIHLKRSCTDRKLVPQETTRLGLTTDGKKIISGYIRFEKMYPDLIVEQGFLRQRTKHDIIQDMHPRIAERAHIFEKSQVFVDQSKDEPGHKSPSLDTCGDPEKAFVRRVETAAMRGEPVATVYSGL